MLEEDKTVSHSVDFDAASMLVAAGLWHMQHAHSVSRPKLVFPDIRYHNIMYRV